MEILYRDSSTSFNEIARQIGTADETVHIRVRRLMTEKIIKKFTLSVNNDLLGYSHLAFLGINVKSGFTDQVIEALSSLDEVLELHKYIIENKMGILPHILKIK